MADPRAFLKFPAQRTKVVRLLYRTEKTRGSAQLGLRFPPHSRSKMEMNSAPFLEVYNLWFAPPCAQEQRAYAAEFAGFQLLTTKKCKIRPLSCSTFASFPHLIAKGSVATTMLVALERVGVHFL